jgi:hypothetical protein
MREAVADDAVTSSSPGLPDEGRAAAWPQPPPPPWRLLPPPPPASWTPVPWTPATGVAPGPLLGYPAPTQAVDLCAGALPVVILATLAATGVQPLPDTELDPHPRSAATCGSRIGAGWTAEGTWDGAPSTSAATDRRATQPGAGGAPPIA